MSVAFLSLPQLPFSCVNQLELHNFRHRGRALPISRFSFVYGKAPWAISINTHTTYRNRTNNSLNPVARECMNSNNEPVTEDNTMTVEQMDQEKEDMDSPWEGAVIFKRNSSNLHLEFCTTLESLGLEKLSSEISKSRASAMGLRTTKAVKDYPHGTPVQISIDITRRIQNIRLDGIIKTVLTGRCSRCRKHVAEGLFSDFSLLLTSEPVEEPEVIDMGVIVEEDKAKSYGQEEDEDSSIDLDDRMYFPPQEKEIDISKYIRDLVHLEILFDAVCDPGCKGICYTCGTNLNASSCDCEDQEEEIVKGSNQPLAGLREQMKKQK